MSGVNLDLSHKILNRCAIIADCTDGSDDMKKQVIDIVAKSAFVK